MSTPIEWLSRHVSSVGRSRPFSDLHFLLHDRLGSVWLAPRRWSYPLTHLGPSRHRLVNPQHTNLTFGAVFAGATCGHDHALADFAANGAGL